MSNLAQRALTALVAVAVVLGVTWIGGWPFAVFMGAVALGAQVEVYRLLRAAGARPLVGLGLVLGALAVATPLVEAAVPLLILGGLVGLGVVLFTRKETPLLDAAGTSFGILYPSLLVALIVRLRVNEADWLVGTEAFWLTMAILFSIWGADTLAYFAGRTFGRHKLFERVSPNKTWEGAAGGALGALLFAAGFKLAVLNGVLTWVDVAAIAFACGVASQFGDLVESLFKRSVGVKDSATWLPGHGGLLDRIDAALVAVPLVVLYFDLVRGV